MSKPLYQVIDVFDNSKEYDFHLAKGYAKCLAALKKGDKLTTQDFLNNYDALLNPTATSKSKLQFASTTLGLGVKVGILKKIERNSISLEEFCKLESISYLRDQTRGSQYKNLEQTDSNGLYSTTRTYVYALYRFNNWLVGKDFEFITMEPTGSDTYKRVQQKVPLKGLEDLLLLYRKSIQSEPDFIKMIKKYLTDPTHAGKSASSMNIENSAIKAYFEKNEMPVQFKFNPKIKYVTYEDEKSLSLEDLMNMLTIGNPSVTQKAVFLCKFHRGLDTITLCDRFNFVAWEQLVNYFGTEQYMKWDLSKCPAPVKLTRMKTNFPHVGFLDIDAIVSLQKYLNHRYEKTGKVMQNGQPIFLNSKNQPIREKWLRVSFARIAKTSGVQKKLDRKGAVRYEKDSHELRDLLKSSLLDSGARPDVADHVIGHKPKDGYEKQAILYPESMRQEYAKASKKINVFSKFSNFLKGGEDLESMQGKITSLETNLAKFTKRLEWTEKTRKKN